MPGPAWPQRPTLNHPRPIMDCKLAATHCSDPADPPVTTFQSGGSTKQSRGATDKVNEMQILAACAQCLALLCFALLCFACFALL